MSKSQRVKGAAGEREWCAKLAEFGFQAKRLLGQARDGGGDVPCPPYLWEVKRRAKIAVYEFWQQAEAALATAHSQKLSGRTVLEYEGCNIPIVAMRADQCPWLVCLAADDFLRIAQQLSDYERRIFHP